MHRMTARVRHHVYSHFVQRRRRHSSLEISIDIEPCADADFHEKVAVFLPANVHEIRGDVDGKVMPGLGTVLLLAQEMNRNLSSRGK